MKFGAICEWIYPFHIGKGDNTIFDSKPHEGLHKHPDVQAELTDAQKETFDILDTRLLGMPTHALKAVSWHYANRCNKQNQLFVLANSEFQDPRSALRAGKALSDCAEDTFKFTLKNCRETFTEFSRCFEKNPARLVGHCRPEQFALINVCTPLVKTNSVLLCTSKLLKMKTCRGVMRRKIRIILRLRQCP